MNIIARHFPQWADAYSGRRSSHDGLVAPEDRAALGSVRIARDPAARRDDFTSRVFALMHSQLHAGGVQAATECPRPCQRMCNVR